MFALAFVRKHAAMASRAIGIVVGKLGVVGQLIGTAAVYGCPTIRPIYGRVRLAAKVVHVVESRLLPVEGGAHVIPPLYDTITVDGPPTPPAAQTAPFHATLLHRSVNAPEAAGVHV